MKLLTALILTAAALATPSALGYYATVCTTCGTNQFGFSVNEDEDNAVSVAIRACQNRVSAPAAKAACADTSGTFARTTDKNQCISVLDTLFGIFYETGLTRDSTNLAADARCATGDLSGFDCERVMFDDDVAVCDHTCEDGESPNAPNIAGCHETTQADCDLLTDTPYLGTDGNCRPALTCGTATDGSVQDDGGGCKPCESGQSEIEHECRVNIQTIITVTMTVMSDTEGTEVTEVTVTNTEVTVVTVTNTEGTVVTITTTTSSGGGGSAAGIIGGVAVVALALWYFTSGSDDLTWTPSYAFANNNGNVSYSVGSRWTATANDWNLYWQTRQNGDKFVYGSGIGYNNGILSAAMNSESEGDKTDLDLDLAANKTIGLWNLGGGYNFDMELSDDATESQNRLNAKVGYIMDKWILSATANTNGDTGTARINYSYRF